MGFTAVQGCMGSMQKVIISCFYHSKSKIKGDFINRNACTGYNYQIIICVYIIPFYYTIYYIYDCFLSMNSETGMLIWFKFSMKENYCLLGKSNIIS